jgi:hypothetical protein
MLPNPWQKCLNIPAHYRGLYVVGALGDDGNEVLEVSYLMGFVAVSLGE